MARLAACSVLILGVLLWLMLHGDAGIRSAADRRAGDGLVRAGPARESLVGEGAQESGHSRRPVATAPKDDGEPPAAGPGLELVVRVIDGTPGAPTEALAVPFAQVRLGDALLVTDAQGVARLSGAPAGEHVLRVQARNFVPFEEAVVIGGSVERPRVVRLHAAAALIYGFVIGPDGAPIADALVCLDTRQRTGSGAFSSARTSRTEHAPAAYSRDVSDEVGHFELAAPAGSGQQSLLVCPGRRETPLIVRRALGRDEQAGLQPVEVHVPGASTVEIRCLRTDGAPGDGRLELSDGMVTYDLADDTVLSRVPDLERWNLLEHTPGRVSLALAPGGYKALFVPEEPGLAMESFFVVVAGLGAQDEVRWLGSR